MFCEQVSTISRKSEDGRTISTRVIQGPPRNKKRIMRVMRDTASGPELIADVEVPADCSDVNTFLETLPSLGRQRHVTRQDSSEHYDNIYDDRLTSTFQHTAVLRQQPNGGSNSPKVGPRSWAYLRLIIIRCNFVMTWDMKFTQKICSWNSDMTYRTQTAKIINLIN